MKNIIWANQAGQVRITIFAPDFECDSEEYAKKIHAQNEGFLPVLFDADTIGLGAAELVYENGSLKAKQIEKVK